MKPAEIEELMELEGWSRLELATRLDVTREAIGYWINGDRVPRGPAVVLMRMWLDQARTEAKDKRELVT